MTSTFPSRKKSLSSHIATFVFLRLLYGVSPFWCVEGIFAAQVWADSIQTEIITGERSPCRMQPVAGPRNVPPVEHGATLSYKDNLANDTARAVAQAPDGAESAYELTHRRGVELMRSKYCLRAELGLCLREAATKHRGPLYLRNNGRILPLRFDCAACEMTVLDA